MFKSVRGAAFFGSSLHLALSFVFLFWFIFDTLIGEINIALWKCDPPEQKFRDIDPLAHYLNIVFKLVYFIGLCVTGVYIFRGVERERPQLLKYAALAFVILQIVGVILFAVFYSIQWNAEPDASPNSPEAARLVSESADVQIPPVTRNCCRENRNENQVQDHDQTSVPNELLNVTPIISESVLPAPEINETTTTTTPIPALAVLVNNGTVTTSTTLTPALAPPPVVVIDNDNETSTLAVPPTIPTETHAETPAPRRKLPHNQVVSLVLQMCLAVANGVGSVAYAIVLALYMLKL